MHQTIPSDQFKTSTDPKTGTPSCLIVGLGNYLLQDDGIGVHVVRCLMPHPPACAMVLEVGTDVFSAVEWLERVPKVLAIDAMDGHMAPGTLYYCKACDVIADKPMTSLHELSLISVLEFIDRHRRPSISVLGVQPAVIDYGTELTPVLKSVLPTVALTARRISQAIAADRSPETFIAALANLLAREQAKPAGA